MRAGRFVKTPDERKQYTIEYTDWLASGETITDHEFEVTPDDGELVVDGSAVNVDGNLLTFFVDGGLDDTQYKVVARITTSLGQVKEDLVRFSIKEI